jgi:hypothetical protein
MDLDTISKAMSVLNDHTRLAIALRLAEGQLNPSLMTRILFKIPATQNNDWGKYFVVWQHFKKLEKAGVISKVAKPLNENGKQIQTQDYIITSEGKEALERKGFRKKSFEQMM